MQDFLSGAAKSSPGPELQDATRICGDDPIGLRTSNPLHFLIEKIAGRFRLRHVVNAGRTAALIGVRHFHKVNSGNRANQFTRSFANLLAVQQVAGVLISHTRSQGLQPGHEPKACEEFSDITDS